MRHTRGPLLTIDVGRREASETAIDAVCSAFIGGRGVGTKLATDRLPRDADPLGPANRLYVSTGPLQTSNVSFTGRTAATSLSPLTDGLLSSNAGGFVSRNIAATGYAAIEVTGQSDTLLAVHVSDQGVEFESVPELAGAEVSAVSEYVQKTRGLGPDSIACIGPAGENEVRFAAIVTSGSRVFGRGGLGAVLGAKDVKFLTFTGDSERTVELPSVAMDVHREAAESDHIMKRQGTASLTEFANEIEALPTRYFSEQSFDGARAIGGEQVEAKNTERGPARRVRSPANCRPATTPRDLKRRGRSSRRSWALEATPGSTRSSRSCARTIAVTNLASTRSPVVTWFLHTSPAATSSGTPTSSTKPSKRSVAAGIGDVLAAGIDRCHDELGVENWTMKGMEFAAHDGRALNGQALAFATANRGADHLYGSMYVLEYPLVDNEAALDPGRSKTRPRY